MWSRWNLVLSALLLGCAPGIRAADVAGKIGASAVELGNDKAGFEALKRSIGDARIVMLGEPWHGDGAAIAERARLVRYLHEQMDFDVLVMEADFYALHQAWEQAGKEKQFGKLAARNIYSFWSESSVSRPLWEYVDAQLAGDDPLIVAGIDPKLVGDLSRTQLPAELETMLKALDGVSAGDARHAADTLAALLARGRDPAAPAVAEADTARMIRLVDRLAGATRGETDFRAQLAQSLKNNINDEDRDPGMAENLIWLATRQFPGKKLIVWAHNNHVLMDKWTLFDGEGATVAKFRADMPTEALGRKTYLGEAVRHYFGHKAVYSLATLSYAGSYSRNIQPALFGRPADFAVVAPLKPALPETLEAALHRAGHSVAFVDLRPFRGEPGVVVSRALDYTQVPALPMRLWDGFDGVLYLDRTYGLNGEL